MKNLRGTTHRWRTSRKEVFLSGNVLCRPVHCGIAQRVKVRFDSSVKDREDTACWLRGSWILACQHWIHKDNSSLMIALSLRTWTKRTKVLSPHLKFAFLCDYLFSAVSLVHLVLLTSGSEGLYLPTVIWARSPMLLHCRVSKDMMQQYSWISLDVEVHVIAAKPWKPSR